MEKKKDVSCFRISYAFINQQYPTAFVLFSSGTICLLNCLSVKWAARVQIIFTVGKFLALVLLIGTGMFRLVQG